MLNMPQCCQRDSNINVQIQCQYLKGVYKGLSKELVICASCRQVRNRRRRLSPVRVSNSNMSSASRQEQLAAQIAALQAQLTEEKAKEEKKRKATQHIRVAASPSPTSKVF